MKKQRAKRKHRALTSVRPTSRKRFTTSTTTRNNRNWPKSRSHLSSGPGHPSTAFQESKGDVYEPVLRLSRRSVGTAVDPSVGDPTVHPAPIRFAGQQIRLPPPRELETWADTFTSTQTRLVADSIATILPLRPEQGPVSHGLGQPTPADYVNYFSTSLSTSPLAASFYDLSPSHRAGLPTPRLPDKSTSKTNPNPNISTGKKGKNGDVRGGDEAAPGTQLRPHFHHFWNYSQPPLTPFTQQFIHRGKYTFNFPPTAAKIVTKAIPLAVTENHPRFHPSYPTAADPNLTLPYFLIPQVTVGEYFSPAADSVGAALADLEFEDLVNPAAWASTTVTPRDQLEPSRTASRTAMEQFIRAERASFVPIDGVITPYQAEFNLAALEALVDPPLSGATPPKHAFTHDHEHVLYPGSENVPGFVRADQTDRTNKGGSSSSSSSSGSSSSSSTSDNNGNGSSRMISLASATHGDPAATIRILPAGTRPDSYPGFPHLPFEPVSAPEPNPSPDPIHVPPSSRRFLQHPPHQSTSLPATPLNLPFSQASATPPSSAPMNVLAPPTASAGRGTGTGTAGTGTDHVHAATPRDNNPGSDPWHNPNRPFDPHPIPPSHLADRASVATSALVRHKMVHSAAYRPYDYDMFRTELLPQMLQHQTYRPATVASGSSSPPPPPPPPPQHHHHQHQYQTAFNRHALSYPLERSRTLTLHREDLDLLHTAQFPAPYQDLFNPLGQHWAPDNPRPGTTLVPSEVLTGSLLNILSDQSLQRDFLPPQLLDFLGPDRSDDIVSHFDQVRATANATATATAAAVTPHHHHYHRDNPSGRQPDPTTLFKYALPFRMANIIHPYPPPRAASIFQQLRQFEYRHYSPLLVSFDSNGNGTGGGNTVDLDVRLFSNTTVRHDPYLQSGWFDTLTKKLQHTEARMGPLAGLPVSTFNLVSTHFTPRAVREAHLDRTLGLHTSPGSPSRAHQRATALKALPPSQLPYPHHLNSDGKGDPFVSVADFCRHPNHDAVLHGAVIDPHTKRLITTFSATYSAPYDPHFNGYNGLSSQLMIYEMIRAGFGYREPRRHLNRSVFHRLLGPLAPTPHPQLASDLINDAFPAAGLPLAYQESFLRPVAL